MKLRVIGQYGRFPIANSGTSCFLLETKKSKIVLDMGCSSLSKIQEFIKIQDIDAIILSHLHGDHIADFKTFTYMASIYKAEGRLKKKIKIFLPDKPKKIYDEIKDCDAFEYFVVKDKDFYSFKDVKIDFYELVHPIETYGQRIESDGRALAYTADTKICDNLNKLIDSADLVIGDACILDKDYSENLPHLSVKQLAKACEDSSVKNLILAHLPDKDNNAIFNEAKNEFKNSFLAKEGQLYTV